MIYNTLGLDPGYGDSFDPEVLERRLHMMILLIQISTVGADLDLPILAQFV